MSENRGEEPPFDGGAQPVKEKRAEVPKAGRTAGQTIVVIIGALVLVAGALYLVGSFMR